MDLGLLQYAGISTVLPTLLPAFALVFKQHKKFISNRIFALLLTSSAIVTAGLVILSSDNLANLNKVGNVFYLFSILYGPALFLYLYSIVKKDFIFNLKYLSLFQK